jgi:hypothetical protein
MMRWQIAVELKRRKKKRIARRANNLLELIFNDPQSRGAFLHNMKRIDPSLPIPIPEIDPPNG